MEKARGETSVGSAAESISAEPILAWKVHLLRESPAKVLLIAPLVAASLLACYLMFRSPLLLAVTVFLLISSLADYLFPVRYEINERGASVRTLLGRTFIEWERVRKYYLDDHGIKLSPLKKPGRLEAYRGVYLRFGSNRDRIIEVVRRMQDVRNARESA